MRCLITIEGADGTGKTTVMEAIREFFACRGIDIVTSREPGGVPIAEEIRRLLLSSGYGEMDARTEALLFAAARRQHYVEKILPLLNDGRVVVLDRFLDSSVAYQGYARGIGASLIEDINDFALEGMRPDLTVLLDMDVDSALARIWRHSEREVNKLDLEKREFHQRVREGYLQIAAAEKNRGRIRVVDASRSPEQVAEDVMRVLESFLKEGGSEKS